MTCSPFPGVASAILLALPLASTALLSAGTPTVSPLQWQSLLTGKVVSLKCDTGNIPSGTSAILIKAPVTAVWRVLADRESAPDYIDGLLAAEVIHSCPAYGLLRQEMKMSAALPKVEYVLRTTDEPHKRMSFERHSGELKTIEGFWDFFESGEGAHTVLVYCLKLETGFPLPRFLLRNSLRKTLPEALRAVRARVYRVASAIPDPEKGLATSE